MIATFLRRAKRRLAQRKDGSEFSGSEFDVLLDHPLLRVTALGDQTAPSVFLCFTGVNQGLGGIGAEEFVGSTQLPGFTAIFISDLTRSWFNAFPPSLLTDAIGEFVSGKHVISIGNSMGGYGAIWVSGHIPVETAIAFGPQFSVHPDVVPGETRWQEYRNAITEWRDLSLYGYFNEQTRYYSINGNDDREHWRHFTSGANQEHLLLAGAGHAPAALLKEHGVLSQTIVSCIHGRSPAALMRDAGLDVSKIENENV